MKVRYKKVRKIDSEQFLNIYKSISWVDSQAGDSEAKSIASAYYNSDIVISAWDDEKMVGVVRALSDKFVNGVIFGLAVHDDYQNQGIGKELLRRCMSVCPKIRWYVWAGKSGVENFYLNQGFKNKEQNILEKLP